MSIAKIQEPSRLIQALYLEGLPLKNNKELKIVSGNSIVKNEHALKNLGFSIGTGFLKGFLTGQCVNLAGKVGVIPDFNYQKIMTEMCFTINKIDNIFIKAFFVQPIIEEFIFRYGIQEVLLEKLPKNIMKLIVPGKETMLDSKIAKVARIILTATLFGYVHLMNKGTFPDAYCNAQVISSFIGGITYGILKESKVELLGCTVAHMSNNILSMSETILYC